MNKRQVLLIIATNINSKYEKQRNAVIGRCTTKKSNVLNSHIKQGIVHLLLYMILEWVVHWTLPNRKGIFCSNDNFHNFIMRLRRRFCSSDTSRVANDVYRDTDMRARNYEKRNYVPFHRSYISTYIYKRDSLLMESFDSDARTYKHTLINL